MRPRNRRLYWRALVTRADAEVRSHAGRIAKHPVGFWIGALSVFGLSMASAWHWLGLPGWLAIALSLLLVLWALSEGAYSLWSEAEGKLAEGAGIGLDGIAVNVWSRPYGSDPDRLLCKFESIGQTERAVVAIPDKGKPRAVEMKIPWQEDLLYPADLPRAFKFRIGRNRHSLKIVKFVDGGIVVDDSDAPLGYGFECVVYFDSPTTTP